MENLFNFNNVEVRKDVLIDLQDNLYTMGELTSDEGKKIISEMSSC